MDKEEELSYEEEQLQLILFNEMKEKKLEEDRAFKEAQTKEYLDALKIDEEKELKDKEEVKVKDEVKDKVKDLKDRVKEENKVTDDEVSVEEMRRIRLLRFQNK